MPTYRRLLAAGSAAIWLAQCAPAKANSPEPAKTCDANVFFFADSARVAEPVTPAAALKRVESFRRQFGEGGTWLIEAEAGRWERQAEPHGLNIARARLARSWLLNAGVAPSLITAIYEAYGGGAYVSISYCLPRNIASHQCSCPAPHPVNQYGEGLVLMTPDQLAR